jgi:hypothetical protein
MRYPSIKHVCSASSKGRKRRKQFAHQKDADGVAGAVDVNRDSAVASLQQLAHGLPAQQDLQSESLRDTNLVSTSSHKVSCPQHWSIHGGIQYRPQTPVLGALTRFWAP